MKIKTSELTGAALDWAVAKCVGQAVILDASLAAYPILVMPGEEDIIDDFYVGYSPSTDWGQGGSIIHRNRIQLLISYEGNNAAVIWVKGAGYGPRYPGPTPLVAACRCYVASKLGDEVEIPEELT